MINDMPDQEIYITEAIEAAAVALLWQAPDATEDGNGFPLTDRNGKLEGETQYVTRVVTEVPYLTEAVTAFVRDTRALLQRGSVTASQAGHDLILTANRCGAGFWDRGLDMPAVGDADTWDSWLDKNGPYPGWHGQTVGDALTQVAHGYSFDAEFALDADGSVTWLIVENIVLVNDCDWSDDPEEDEPRHPDAYEYGEPWGPDNPAPGSPWARPSG